MQLSKKVIISALIGTLSISDVNAINLNRYTVVANLGGKPIGRPSAEDKKPALSSVPHVSLDGHMERADVAKVAAAK